MSTDDLGLIARTLDGSTDDYGTLVDRHKNALYRHCFHIMHDEDMAEDMAQEAFIRAYTKLRMYDPAKAGFKTWLFTIATNLCLEQLRRKRSLPLEDAGTVVSTRPALIEGAAARELRELVLKLAPKHRTAISLHYWYGYSYEEIAQYMEAPIGSVRGWIHRAKQQLKEALS